MNGTTAISSYANLLNIDLQMSALQADLQLKLAEGDKNGAEADIEQLKALAENMTLLAHEAKMMGNGYLQSDLSDMETRLNAMKGDVQNGQFSAAETLNTSVKSDIADIFHVIVI